MKYADKRDSEADSHGVIFNASDILQGSFLVIEWQGTLITVDVFALVFDIVILMEIKG